MWNFGDGTTGTGSQVTHTYNVPSSTAAENIGTFLPTVTVTDAKGQTCIANPDGIVAMSPPRPDTGNYFSVDPNVLCELPYNIAYGTMWSGVPGAYAGDPINFTMKAIGVKAHKDLRHRNYRRSGTLHLRLEFRRQYDQHFRRRNSCVHNAGVLLRDIDGNRLPRNNIPLVINRSCFASTNNPATFAHTTVAHSTVAYTLHYANSTTRL